MTIIAVSRVIRQHWQWQSVGYGPVKDVKFCFHTSNLTGLPKIWNSAPTLPFGQTTNDVTWHPFHTSALPIEVPLPHFCPVLAANDLKLSFCTSALPGLLKVWSFASAIPLCLYCQRSEVPLSVLPLGQDFEKARSSSALVLPAPPNMGKSSSAFHLCRDFQRCEVTLPHFCSALTANDMKFSFRTSALPGLRRSRSSSALVLSGLPNMGKSTSAFLVCRDFQSCEVPLPPFCSALTAKDLRFSFPYFRSARTSKDHVHLPDLFCQVFQVWVSPFPHFISAETSKDMKFLYHNSALP